MAAVGKVGLKAGSMVLKPYKPPDLLQVFEGVTPPRMDGHVLLCSSCSKDFGTQSRDERFICIYIYI